MSAPGAILATAIPGTEGSLACAATLAVELADPAEAVQGAVTRAPGAVALVEVGSRPRGPTLLASLAARELEERLCAAGHAAVARGRLAWVATENGPDAAGVVAAVIEVCRPDAQVVVHLPAGLWRAFLEHPGIPVAGALVRADLPRRRALAALCVRELRERGLSVRVASRAPGRVATRRAFAGIDPGGEAGGRIARLARGLARPGASAASQSGQALPLVLGACLVLVLGGLALAALGGAATGKSRLQRVADLAALSAARSMRDDFDRLLAPARLADGSPNPAHLPKAAFLERAGDAASEAVARNEADPARLTIAFPDAGSFAPVRVRVRLRGSLDTGGSREPILARAEAEAVPATAASEAPPAVATGGGYSGPLSYRQGEGMRPDVASAFDRLAAAARAAGHALIVNSGFRSDAEQAALFAANPDPRWVAPPGRSLHRCATELDLGPPSAYGWLAANAARFGFSRRYSWEPWHFGFVRPPAPCSRTAAATIVGPAAGRGRSEDGSVTAAGGLPVFVPGRYRAAIARAAARWDVSGALLAAQLMAESNFNPLAVSGAGAAGIAQFMPATAAAYGLRDRFDPEASIDAQAHLMSDLLRRFGGSAELALAAYNAGPAPVSACSCVPAYPETQAYVARIVGLVGAAGVAAAPALEVRLVE